MKTLRLAEVIELLEEELVTSRNKEAHGNGLLVVEEIELELLADITNEYTGKVNRSFRILMDMENSNKKSNEYHRIKLKVRPSAKIGSLSKVKIEDTWTKLTDVD